MVGVQDYLGEKNILCKEKEIMVLKGSMIFKVIMKYSMIINNYFF